MADNPIFESDTPARDYGFHTTHWSVVLAAGQTDSKDAHAALEALCHTYWFPLYAYVRRQGRGADEAQDLTQEFFVRLLDKQYLRLADSARGKFRTFLLTSLKNFLINEWQKARIAKRGGGQSLQPWTPEEAERRYLAEPARDLSPDRLFEKRWAVAVVERAQERLRQEYEAANKLQMFQELKEYVWGDTGGRYSELAARLNTTEGALRIAAHRMKERFRGLLREEVAHTAVTNGSARPFFAGGGVGFAMHSDAVLSNCMIVGCSAKYGGGAGPGGPFYGYRPLGGTLINCTLRSNSASHFDFNIPGVGGGAYGTTLNNCILTGNSAQGFGFDGGGGASSSRLQNCILTGNSASGSGGGAVRSELVNCTLTGNSASSAGGGTSDNTAMLGSIDLDGRPRIQDSTVDMGVYEFQPGVSGEFIGWLSSYSLPTDGSADDSDSDSDLMNNWQEWTAGTVPTDASSTLRLFNPSTDETGVTVSWQSVSNRTYFVERAGRLAALPAFSTISSNIAGQPGRTSYIDTNTSVLMHSFYRVGVSP